MIIFYSFDVSKSEALTFIENKISLKSFTTQILNSFVKLSSMQMKTRRNNILDKQTLINCGTKCVLFTKIMEFMLFRKIFEKFHRLKKWTKVWRSKIWSEQFAVVLMNLHKNNLTKYFEKKRIVIISFFELINYTLH